MRDLGPECIYERTGRNCCKGEDSPAWLHVGLFERKAAEGKDSRCFKRILCFFALKGPDLFPDRVQTLKRFRGNVDRASSSHSCSELPATNPSLSMRGGRRMLSESLAAPRFRRNLLGISEGSAVLLAEEVYIVLHSARQRKHFSLACHSLGSLS